MTISRQTPINSGHRRSAFSRRFAFLIRSCIALLAAALMFPAAPSAAAETWIACEGTVTTSDVKDGKTETSSAAAKDVYVYDDALKALFKYSDARKSLSPLFVTSFDDKGIVWANAGGKTAGSLASAWEGRINRADMSLKLTRTERSETLTWSQTCKGTGPQPISQESPK